MEHTSILVVLVILAIVVSTNVLFLFGVLKRLRDAAKDKRVRRSFKRHQFFVKSYDYMNRVVPRIVLKNKNKQGCSNRV